MTVYRGIVRDNVVVLDEPARLPDGAIVEVHPIAAPSAASDVQADRAAFLQSLLAQGVIRAIPRRLPDPPGLDRTLLEVVGPPVSQTLIEDRR